MTGIYRLKGQVKQYHWGGDSFLPQLLQLDNPEHQSFAEYWLGIHPQGPSSMQSLTGSSMPLSAKEPGFSYLLKILDVRDMLSIQVHPNSEMARAGFERENQLGIPIDSPTRNYKDVNPKPELMVALSEFWLLHGFQSPEKLRQTLSAFPALARVQQQWESLGNRGVYQWLMELPQSEVDQLLQAPASEWVAAYQNGALSKSDPAFWAARAVLSFCRSGSMDRGIFSIFLFNLLKLESGQGIYQGAGVPHAYLEGHAVEIMSNSDNVLRGGLTPKHIDVAELLRHIHTEFIEPQIIQPRPDTTGLRTYPVPVDDFKIRSISLGVGEAVQYRSDDSLILLLPEGELELESGSDRLRLGAPDLCAYLSPQTPFSVRALRPSLLFIASGRSGSPD